MSNVQVKMLLQNLYTSKFYSHDLSVTNKFPFETILGNQRVQDRELKGYEKIEDIYITRLKTISIHLPENLGFDLLLNCMQSAFNDEEIQTQYDEQIEQILTIMKIDLSQQKYQDPLDCIGKFTIIIKEGKNTDIDITPFILFCKNAHKILDKSRYKAFRVEKTVYLYFIDAIPVYTHNESRLKDFKKLHIPNNEIKNYYFKLNKTNVAKIKRQFSN